jgi:hypothetical protein
MKMHTWFYRKILARVLGVKKQNSNFLCRGSNGQTHISLLHGVQTDCGAPIQPPRGLSSRGVKLTTLLLLVPRWEKVELNLHPYLSSWQNV